MFAWMIMPYRRYAEFGGRSRRMEYWSFVLFTIVVNAVLSAVFGHVELARAGAQSAMYLAATGGSGPIGGIFALVNFIPSLAVAVRRLHDQDRSGWLLLLIFVPILGWFALFVIFLLNGTTGRNRYGPDPKQPYETDVFR